MFTLRYPPQTQWAGGCNCAFKAPTPPTCRDIMDHLPDCPAFLSGLPVGLVLKYMPAPAAACAPQFAGVVLPPINFP